MLKARNPLLNQTALNSIYCDSPMRNADNDMQNESFAVNKSQLASIKKSLNTNKIIADNVADLNEIE